MTRRDLVFVIQEPNVAYARCIDFRRHARACRGHPRFHSRAARKTWMAGTSPAMTKKNAPVVVGLAA
jgi:hypothetical protein